MTNIKSSCDIFNFVNNYGRYKFHLLTGRIASWFVWQWQLSVNTRERDEEILVHMNNTTAQQ